MYRTPRILESRILCVCPTNLKLLLVRGFCCWLPINATDPIRRIMTIGILHVSHGLSTQWAQKTHLVPGSSEFSWNLKSKSSVWSCEVSNWNYLFLNNDWQIQHNEVGKVVRKCWLLGIVATLNHCEMGGMKAVVWGCLAPCNEGVLSPNDLKTPFPTTVFNRHISVRI